MTIQTELGWRQITRMITEESAYNYVDVLLL